jgi:ribose transport system substrate-binding protein
MRLAYLALALCAACLPAIGCGPKTNYKYKIAVIPKGLTHEHWQSVKRGAERAAADLTKDGVSVQILWEGPTREDEAQPQIDIVNQFIARKVNGIVLAPQHSENMVEVVRKANQDDIPVVILDSGLNADELFIKYVATDNYRGGKMAAQRLLDVLKKDGKEAPRLVLFRYKAGSESTEKREQGFLDEVNRVIAQQKTAGKPTITWVSTNQELGATKDQAEANARPLLSKKAEEIDGIFAPNESSASGVVQVLRGIKPANKVRLVSFDSSEPLLQALRDGEVDGLIVQDPYRMGYLGVWIVVQKLEGVNVSPDGKKELSTGEYLVTRENLDKEAIRGLFVEAVQADRTIDLPKFKK